MTKHTRGSWSFDGHGINDENGERIATMAQPACLGNGRTRNAQRDADGALIAAAPDLLAAARELLLNADDRGETRDRSTGERYEDWERLRAAIGKAE